MEAKDVINLVKSIKEQKEQKVKSKEIQIKKKEKDKDDFYRCKSKCVCKEDRCLATGLKQCPSCHSILRSVCSKARCKVDDKKPKMLLLIAATKKRTSRKLFESFDESESETDASEESDGDIDVSDDSDCVMRHLTMRINQVNPKMKLQYHSSRKYGGALIPRLQKKRF